LLKCEYSWIQIYYKGQVFNWSSWWMDIYIYIRTNLKEIQCNCVGRIKLVNQWTRWLVFMRMQRKFRTLLKGNFLAYLSSTFQLRPWIKCYSCFLASIIGTMKELLLGGWK
jgi:hypothetical protein